MNLKEFDEASLNNKMKMAKDMILASDINGCIAGSSMITDDFESWESCPDIDVFVYNDVSYGYAMAYLEANGFVPGGKGKKDEAEEIRKSWTLGTGLTKKYPVNTIQYHRGDIAINVTIKKDSDNMLDTICSFDMSIVMIAVDITTKKVLDLRGPDLYTATPNPYKQKLNNHPSRYTVAYQLRQWDRVIKYANRGYDTRPMAEFYKKLVQEVLDAGAVFGSEKDMKSFEEMEPGFREMLGRIDEWLKEEM